MFSVDELEKEYYDFSKLPSISNMEVLDKTKDESTNVKEIKPNELHPFSVSERIDWLERRMDDLERMLSLINRSIVENKQKIDERLDRLDEELHPLIDKRLSEHKQDIDKRLDGMENQEMTVQKFRDELSSLSLLVKKTMEVNEEIKTKTPQILREFESKINNLAEEFKKVKEDSNKSYYTNPVILE